jgi:hypothetical protein
LKKLRKEEKRQLGNNLLEITDGGRRPNELKKNPLPAVGRAP